MTQEIMSNFDQETRDWVNAEKINLSLKRDEVLDLVDALGQETVNDQMKPGEQTPLNQLLLAHAEYKAMLFVFECAGGHL